MADRTGAYRDYRVGNIPNRYIDNEDGTWAQRLSARSLGAGAEDIIGSVNDRVAGQIPVLYVKQPDGTYAQKVVVADLEPGPTGPAGPEGPAGPAGEDGADGAPGAPGTTLHSGLSDVTPDQHHARDHALNGATHAGQLDHETALTNVGERTHANIDTDLNTMSSDIEDHVAETTTAHGGIVASSDSRLTDARTPTGAAGGQLSGTYPDPSVAASHSGSTHAATQAAAEATAAAALAAKKLDDLAPPDDNMDLNASTAAHGLMQKYPGGTTTYLRADGTFATPTATAADPSYSPGSFTLADGTYRVMADRLHLAGVEEATLEGDATLVII